MRKCHGTSREHGSRTSKRARDVRTGESRDSTPPLTSELLRGVSCHIVYKKPNYGKKFCQPFSALLRPTLRRLRQFGPSMFYRSATDLSGPKHSPASVASYTSVLAAWRRFAEARTVPFLASSSSTVFPCRPTPYSPPAGLVPEALCR